MYWQQQQQAMQQYMEGVFRRQNLGYPIKIEIYKINQDKNKQKN